MTLVDKIIVYGGLALLVWFFVAAVRGVRRIEQKQRRIHGAGLRAVADVVAVESGRARRGKDLEAILTLEIAREGQPAYRTRASVFVSPFRIPTLQPGARVAVLIDPEDANTVLVDLDAPAPPRV